METVNSISNKLLTKEEYARIQEEYMEYWKNESDKHITDYKVFLDSVHEYTKIIAGSCAAEDSIGENITYDILGPEFRLTDYRLRNSLYAGYDRSVIGQAMQEVPNQGLKENSMWLYRYDYESAEVKLGCLVHEGISASQILDLGYLMELLLSYGINSYIDNERQVFHLNARKPQLHERKLNG